MTKRHSPCLHQGCHQDSLDPLCSSGCICLDLRSSSHWYATSLCDLPRQDNSFDVITNVVSVDYLNRPIEVRTQPISPLACSSQAQPIWSLVLTDPCKWHSESECVTRAYVSATVTRLTRALAGLKGRLLPCVGHVYSSGFHAASTARAWDHRKPRQFVIVLLNLSGQWQTHLPPSPTAQSPCLLC